MPIFELIFSGWSNTMIQTVDPNFSLLYATDLINLYQIWFYKTFSYYFQFFFLVFLNLKCIFSCFYCFATFWMFCLLILIKIFRFFFLSYICRFYQNIIILYWIWKIKNFFRVKKHAYRHLFYFFFGCLRFGNFFLNNKYNCQRLHCQ